MAISLVLADDHPIVLDGLENLLRREGDLNVLARCTRADQTLEAVRQCRPDVLILDLKMQGSAGLAVLRKLKEEKLSTRVVLLMETLDEYEFLEAVRVGVSGVVLKEMAPHLFIQCVRMVHAGEHWIEKHSYRRALEKLLQREAGAREFSAILTPREIEIVHMVASELRNREIAERLFISEGTVKTHLHRIYGKLHVRNRRELALHARERGLTRHPNPHREAE